MHGKDRTPSWHAAAAATESAVRCDATSLMFSNGGVRSELSYSERHTTSMSALATTPAAEASDRDPDLLDLGIQSLKTRTVFSRLQGDEYDLNISQAAVKCIVVYAHTAVDVKCCG